VGNKRGADPEASTSRMVVTLTLREKAVEEII
jgi:hypothetical protein